MPVDSQPTRHRCVPRTLAPAVLTALAVAAGTLVGVVPGSAVAASAAPAADHRAVRGSNGIGDSYFPLDGNGGIDVRHYRIDQSYDFARGRLRGRTTLRLRTTQRLRSFHLDLLLPVRSVRVDGRRARFRSTHHELRIRPARPLAAGRTVRVVVRYAGRPGTRRYAGEQNWLASRDEVAAVNQPHMAPWWFPANDHPSDRATFDVRTTVPRGMQVISNGRPVSSRVHGGAVTHRWRSTEEMTPYLAFFVAGRFQRVRADHGDVPGYLAVSRTLPSGARREAMSMLRRTPAVLGWLEDRIGREYPFSSTGGVVTGLPLGFALENQTRPVYGGLGHNQEWLLVHELAHQWFGDHVTVHRWRDVWLNEGAATFFETEYGASRGGPSARDWLRGQWTTPSGGATFWKLRVDDPGAARLFDRRVYTRGAMALQALRHRIGEDDFWAVLRTWLDERGGSTGSTAQFEELAQRVSGEDLRSFFDAWLRGRTAPARTVLNGWS